MRRRIRRADKRRLLCERLESRCVLSASAGDFHPVLVAGDPAGSPVDSPALRVDANASASPFAGVGSLQINASAGTYICTGTLIDSTHVLTAGHCVDFNNDGKSNWKDGITGIWFNVNTESPFSVQAASWQTHPEFTGFARPSVNDDLAVITLSSAASGVPTYSLPTSDMTAGTQLYLVGYGRSGDGVNGYTVSPSYSVKRHGENMADAFYGQDDRRKPSANEVFRFDFDGASGNGSFGGGTLGNDIETTLGGGDSGGPSFGLKAGADPALSSSYVLIGVNTFTQGTNAPLFGSLGGGINVFPYVGWIQGVSPTSSDGGGGEGPGGSAKGSGVFDAMAADFSVGLVEYLNSAIVIHYGFESCASPVSEVRLQMGTFSSNAALIEGRHIASNSVAQRQATDDHDSISREQKSRRHLLVDQIESLESKSFDFVSAVDEVLTHWAA